MAVYFPFSEAQVAAVGAVGCAVRAYPWLWGGVEAQPQALKTTLRNEPGNEHTVKWELLPWFLPIPSCLAILLLLLPVLPVLSISCLCP